MIIITGDSWSVGEIDNDTHSITHTGLEQYLKDDGYQVCNIGQSGNSNLDLLGKLEVGLITARACNQTVSHVFAFQTEWTRDFAPMLIGANAFKIFNREAELFSGVGYDLNDKDDFFTIFNIKSPTDLAERIVQNFYRNLSKIAEKYQVKIWVIGGCSDTLQIDPNEYPGVAVGCQSMYNLLTKKPTNSLGPTLSYYTDIPTQDWLKKQFPNHLEELIKLYDQGNDKICGMMSCKELFWPNGTHPNREGQKVLYNFLKTQNIV